MPNYADRPGPFAAKFSFISDLPLEECIARLIDAPKIPFEWPRGYYRPFRWRFTYSAVDADLCEFQAITMLSTRRRVFATDIAARGRLQRIENAGTYVIGCADATEIFYEFMIFMEILKFIIFVWIFNNGTRNGWLVVAFVEGVLFCLTVCPTLLTVWFMSKRLARILEHLVAIQS